MIFDGNWAEAPVLSQKMMAKPLGQLPYQPVGDVLLLSRRWPMPRSTGASSNLRTGTAAVQFTSEGTTFTRELFASAPDNVMVLRLPPASRGRFPSRCRLRTDQILSDVDGGADDTLIVNGTNRPAERIAGALKFQTRD